METRPGGTRERILNAAGVIFARRGFKAATVRQIAEASGANIAAVSYYFRSKQGLYRAVLEDLLAGGFEKFPADMGIDASSGPEDRLRAFVRSFFYRLLSREGWGGYEGKARLIAKEFSDPSSAMGKAVEKHILPHKRMLVQIISDLLGPGAAQETVLRCAFSIIGQCLYYVLARPVIDRIAPEGAPAEDRIEALADHVIRFSLGGIAHLKTSFQAASQQAVKERA